MINFDDQILEMMFYKIKKRHFQFLWWWKIDKLLLFSKWLEWCDADGVQHINMIQNEILWV